MPFHDLNLAYTADHNFLSNTLSFAKELGYDTVALTQTITGTLPNPLPIIPTHTIPKLANLNLLTRLTLTISDTQQNHNLPSLSQQYNIIALRPTSEKTLQQCCLNLECDLISLDFSQRLSFTLKFTMMAAALQRGIRFEICYGPGIVSGSEARRNLISGATQLIRATRGRGIVISSEAKTALGLRAPWDVVNLAQVWGLPQQRGKEAVCEEAGRVVRLAALKRTSHRGVVNIVDGGALNIHQPTRKDKELRSRPNKTGSTVSHNVQDQVARLNSPSEKSSATIPAVGEQSGAKRKASATSLNATQSSFQYQDRNQTQHDEKPLSNREKKRRAKKAKLEAKENSNIVAVNDMSSIAFPVKHEIHHQAANKPK